MSDLYQEIILEESQHPQHVGNLKGADYHLAGTNASCGDSFQIFVKLGGDPELPKYDRPIEQIKWKGQGCAISTATMSLLSQEIMHNQLTLRDVAKLTKPNLLKLLGLESITPGREKCLMLGLKTLRVTP